MTGKIAYRYATPVHPAEILYVNVVANYSCFNDCLFCSRPGSAGERNLYEMEIGGSLFLPQRPTVEDILSSISSEIKSSDEELAIVGLGEPLTYLPVVLEVIEGVKGQYDIRTRVNTNGSAKCLHENPVRRLEEAGLDEVRISLNATSEREYNRLCRPRLIGTYQNLLDFVRECVGSSIDTHVSFVTGFQQRESNQEFAEFAGTLGVDPEHVIFREFLRPTG